jgi:SWI/SNF-related matrix-associated actin-dependent regulator 1 of chromatin subfamily A
MNLLIQFDKAQGHFTIDTGGVQVPAIGNWLGWKRTTRGNYVAPAYPSTVLSMAPSPSAQLTWREDAAMVRDSLLQKLQLARMALGFPSITLNVPTERRPRQHQSQAIAAMKHMGWRVLLADDMGLGKTSSALWAAHDAGVRRILVVCPVSVKFNWKAELETTLGEGFTTFVIDGTNQHRASQIANATNASEFRSTAVIINYDLLLHLTPEQRTWLIFFARDGMVLFDESHYLKSSKAKRTKESQDIAAQAKFVCCLTGTPIRNMADDLFTQVELVRPGTWSSYRDFAKRYLVIQSVKFGKRDVQKVVGTKNLTELNAVMNTLQISRKKHEAIDLPPKVYSYPELELDGDLLKLYKAMKEFARMELRSLTVSGQAPVSIFDPRAKSAVEQAMRCEQIAQGFIGGIPDPVMAKLGADVLKHAEKIPGRPNELIFPSSPKMIWLLEAIESVLAQGGCPIVPSRFNAPLFWLQAELERRKIRARLIEGSLTAKEKDSYVVDFQEQRADVLLAQVKMCEGFNAFRSQDVLFLGRDWSPAINAQAEDRAHRMGQKGTVNVQIPIVRKTIEVMIHKRLLDKAADAQQALRSVTIEELMEAL